MNKKQILEYLSSQNLDIRIRGKNPASRFIDQKVTPDVLSVVSNSILSLRTYTFTSRDIWDSYEFATCMIQYFGKGNVNLQDFKNEYDKVIGQCLNTLNFSNIITLIGKKGAANNFQINNEELLIFIASSDRNAYTFLVNYLNETLKQSDFNGFTDFLTSNNMTNTDYVVLKENFDLFMKKNSNIAPTNYYETKRIFTKIINPLAVYYSTQGSRSGRLSKTPIMYSELLYNRTNWRDIGKAKGISRQEYRHSIDNTISEKARIYSTSKAKQTIKDYHLLKSPDNMIHSEILDTFSNDCNTLHAHHIFPESDFEELSDTLENIILLTPNQHLGQAHPNGNTQIISRHYQEKCLLAKLNTIMNSKYSDLYNLENFLDVLETGLNLFIDKNIFNGMTNIEIVDYLSKEIKNYYILNFFN